MKTPDLIKALGQLKVQTGSLACLGCGYEHNCSMHGCALIQEAVTQLSWQAEAVRCADCCLWEPEKETYGFRPDFGTCRAINGETTRHDFCGCGERKGGGTPCIF